MTFEAWKTLLGAVAREPAEPRAAGLEEVSRRRSAIARAHGGRLYSGRPDVWRLADGRAGRDGGAVAAAADRAVFGRPAAVGFGPRPHVQPRAFRG